ncbi:MAG: hypothetical protein ACM3O7_00560, partial [Acidobacteriota bacterium]
MAVERGDAVAAGGAEGGSVGTGLGVAAGAVIAGVVIAGAEVGGGLAPPVVQAASRITGRIESPRRICHSSRPGTPSV